MGECEKVTFVGIYETLTPEDRGACDEHARRGNISGRYSQCTERVLTTVGAFRMVSSRPALPVEVWRQGRAPMWSEE